MAPIKSSTSGIPSVKVSAPASATAKSAPLPSAKLPAPAVPDRFTSIARPASDFSNRDLTRNNDLLARLQAARGSGADAGEFFSAPAETPPRK